MQMQITMLNRRTMKVVTPWSKSTVDFLGGLLGSEWIDDGRYWAVPITQFGRIVERFGSGLLVAPEVSAAYDPERFALNFVALFLRDGSHRLVLDGDCVRLEGPAVSPVVEQGIERHAAALRRIIERQVEGRR